MLPYCGTLSANDRKEQVMASDDLPIPEPRGTLVPPSRRPPTAVGADTVPPVPPVPPRLPHRHVHVERHVTYAFAPDLKRLIAGVLDAVDTIADIVATELGLRPESRRPPSAPTQPSAPSP